MASVRKLKDAGILTCANAVAAMFVACVIAGSFAALFACLTAPDAAAATTRVVLIHDGDGAVHEMPLDEDGCLEVRTSAGMNVIRVEAGRAFMESADCDGQDCVHQGALDGPGAQIICLPHQLWMEVVDAGASGSALDVTSVGSAGADAAGASDAGDVSDADLDVVSR